MAKSGPTVLSVFRGEREVLRIKDMPGRLSSRALPPPGAALVTHPFLTASALDIMEEGSLREILERARSFDEFVVLLKKAGYDVRDDGKAL